MLQDCLGGDLLMADVCVDGKKIGVHYWNRLPEGTVIDLTSDQFQPGEELTDPCEVNRPPGPPKKGAEAYHLLSRRVQALLDGD